MSGSAFVRAYLYGGLGNQLFQYAAGRSLAARLGTPLVLDASSFALPGEGRRYHLQGYAIDAAVVAGPVPPFPNLEQAGGPILVGLRRWRRWLREGDWRGRGWHGLAGPKDRMAPPRFREGSYDYDRRFAELRKPVSLVGFWQSEKYFAPSAETIRSELRLKAPPSDENRRWLEAIGEPGAVCIHVRRGDYLSAQAFPVHGLCAPAYYERAMAHVRERIDRPRFFVFSDDWDWTGRQFTAGNCVQVKTNGRDAPEEDLRLMSACRHHIIANSSLSWWAAWLGRQAGQIVIAPEPWFSTRRATPDLLPDGWLRLPRE